MNFADLLNPKLILCDLQAESHEMVYLEMLEALKSQCKDISEPRIILKDILEHERLVDMPYDVGFAIPHTRSAGVSDLHLVLGIHKKGIKLQDCDQERSKIIILFLVSTETSKIYLLILKALARYFSSPGMSDKLASCNSPSEVISQFQKDKVEINHSIKAEDIMSTSMDCMPESGMLGSAIDVLAQTKRLHIPIVDSDGRLIGDFNIDSILQGSVPDYIRMMDNLNFLPEFEPFDKILKNEDRTPVNKFIDHEPNTCKRETPLMDVVIRFIKDKVTCLYVVDETMHPEGVITKHELISNLLRS
ncbi:PTS sugar transporter subunit IIA [Lentisphaera profundi]|uniref:PTS sugar transporter subunit IIA n=1 Tax=Lentisphaera profundi TaxID=1658616 RepID=A0ABY7VTY0_9BACT|nr:PTS sugar transporter subunit IIA [Lentisphaera profundi]WDE96728.1 PTS sugar transporter subunit IIA [Lentisphaera profundi]